VVREASGEAHVLAPVLVWENNARVRIFNFRGDQKFQCSPNNGLLLPLRDLRTGGGNLFKIK
jgi:hypothetical protein